MSQQSVKKSLTISYDELMDYDALIHLKKNYDFIKEARSLTGEGI